MLLQERECSFSSQGRCWSWIPWRLSDHRLRVTAIGCVLSAPAATHAGVKPEGVSNLAAGIVDRLEADVLYGRPETVVILADHCVRTTSADS
jgi:hypothetical protein